MGRRRAPTGICSTLGSSHETHRLGFEPSQSFPTQGQPTFPLGIFPATSLPLAISAPTITE